MQISKSNDPRIVKNDPYLTLYLQAATSTDRTQYIGLPEVFEDIRAVVPNMTPERGRSVNPKMQPLPDKWQFCNILSKVNHDDPDEFEARIADILFWTLPFAGNPVCCIPLRRNEDYLIQTKEETGQYTLDLFADDAVADVLSYHKFWEKPEKGDATFLAAQVAFDVLKDLSKKGLSCFSSNSQYIQKTFLKGMPDKDADKIAGLAEQLLITSGLMDNTNRKTDDNDIRLSLSCLGESFVNIIDSINPGKINYLYFRNYDMSFRFALCERIAKQIVADGYDFYMSIEKTERSEKRSVAKPVKTKEPLNIWETYIVKPEEKKPAPKFVEPEPGPEPEEKSAAKISEEVCIIIDEAYKFLNREESSIQEIKAYPKALSEQEVKEEMHRPMNTSETEENKSYTSNLTPRPPFVPPQDPLVLARDTDKVDEDRVLALSQNITEFMVKEKSNLPPNVKTALKEALMALMEL
ncbi:MAG: hypothetical protein J6Y02_08100 [Pseudobutyrivibrio sp.]|nr:hypothetical protein [Pseudobutyrivibrio sp.]